MRKHLLVALSVVPVLAVVVPPAAIAAPVPGAACAPAPVVERLVAAPEAVSPRNHDGVKDTTTLSALVHAAGTVRFSVVDGDAVLRRSGAMAAAAGSTVRWTWNGTDSTGGFVPDGSYRAVVRWQPARDGCPGEAHDVGLTVDNTAPRFGTTSNTYQTFYPRYDDAFGPYRDYSRFAVTDISEVAGVRMALYEHGSARAVAVHLLGTYPAGTTAGWNWHGRHHGGQLMPAGHYDFRFRLRDTVGNLRWTPRGSFWLSHRHVVAHTVTRTLDGWDYASVFNNNECDAVAVGGDTGRPPSAYERGLHIVFHDCLDQQGRFSVTWALPVPAAAVYDTFSPFVYGHAETGDGRSPPTLGLPFAVWNQRNKRIVRVGVTGTAEGRHPLDTVRLGQFVRETHHFELSAWLTSADAEVGDRNFDVRNVGVVVRYGTLEF